MYWNAIKVFTYPLECLSYVFWVIWAWFACSTNHAQIARKSPKRHKKDTRAGKWTLLLHYSTYSGHRIISHTIFLCPPLTLATCDMIWTCMSPSKGGVGEQASTKPDLLKSFLLVKVKITDEGRKWILQDCFAMFALCWGSVQWLMTGVWVGEFEGANCFFFHLRYWGG